MEQPSQYWFNTYYSGTRKVYTSPYPAREGKEEPKYATVHGPYTTSRDAANARRELISEEVADVHN
jgi:hypothetical protein